ncbi:MAG TPA: tRNA pseudouridine(55) synthase TruB, partial [Fibrobacteria bacterium]|nr:tRNA pseudouridine(55) synthase TruB [Fibrobacteria bacterium]
MSATGFLLLDKPKGRSSQQALSPVKRLLGERRVGHAGTLDPLATGLLVVAAGKATRLLSRIEGQDKEYLVSLRPGVRTDSLDTDGRILSQTPASWDGADWADLLGGLLGEVDQVPPAFS